MLNDCHYSFVQAGVLDSPSRGEKHMGRVKAIEHLGFYPQVVHVGRQRQSTQVTVHFNGLHRSKEIRDKFT